MTMNVKSIMRLSECCCVVLLTPFTCIILCLSVLEVWKQVLKRKHALDHGSAVFPVHASQLPTCTHACDVGCQIM